MKAAAKVLAIGGAMLLLTTLSGTETISMWGPLVLICTITALMTVWVLAGDRASSQDQTTSYNKAA
jgi:hypothetical protein